MSNRRCAHVAVVSLLVALIPPVLSERLCERPEFLCGTGSCIARSLICDGTRDCSDGSDETTNLCAHRPCGASLEHVVMKSDLFQFSQVNFRCSYGACISDRNICDGFANCFDGSDETEELCSSRSCGALQFRCNYGACILKQYQCNGQRICNDGSDETAEACRRKRKVCNRLTHFRCSYGACIAKRYKCDGKYDCVDYSDETEELCGVFPPPLPSTSTASPGVKVKVNERPPLPLGPAVVIPNSGDDDSDLPKMWWDIMTGLLPNLGSGKPPNIPAPPPPMPINTPEVTTPKPEEKCQDFECPCPEPFHPPCIPCHGVQNVRDTCDQIGNDDVCSLKTWQDVHYHILSCGVNASLDMSVFSRKRVSCGENSSGVPVLAVVLVNCWGIEVPLQCHADGLWHSIAGEKRHVMKTLCQPLSVNSPICGRIPRFRRPTGNFVLTSSILGHRKGWWPMVVGLFIDGTFKCSGTIISPSTVITAAHCVTSFKAETNAGLLAHRLQIQRYDGEKDGVLENVSAIHIYPEYYPGPGHNDLAIVRLAINLTFSEKMYPACVDDLGKLHLVNKTALTFNRTKNIQKYSWTMFIQSFDIDCENRESTCSRAVAINDGAFCSINKDQLEFLHQGSSGGPYLVDNGYSQEEKWSIAGIVSRNIEMSQCPKPFTVMTRVSSYYSWIVQCTETGQCN